MFLGFLLLVFGFLVFMGCAGHLRQWLHFIPQKQFIFYCVGWYIGFSALLIDIVYNGASCSLWIIFLALVLPVVCYHALRALKRFVQWALGGLQKL